MKRARIKIAVHGFTDKEGAEGAPDVLEELRERSWLLNPSVKWDKEQSLLLISIDYESDNLATAEEAVHDEVWDCVISSIHFSGNEIHFEPLEARFL